MRIKKEKKKKYIPHFYPWKYWLGIKIIRMVDYVMQRKKFKLNALLINSI